MLSVVECWNRDNLMCILNERTTWGQQSKLARLYQMRTKWRDATVSRSLSVENRKRNIGSAPFCPIFFGRILQYFHTGLRIVNARKNTCASNYLGWYASVFSKYAHRHLRSLGDLAQFSRQCLRDHLRRTTATSTTFVHDRPWKFFLQRHDAQSRTTK